MSRKDTERESPRARRNTFKQGSMRDTVWERNWVSRRAGVWVYSREYARLGNRRAQKVEKNLLPVLKMAPSLLSCMRRRKMSCRCRSCSTLRTLEMTASGSTMCLEQRKRLHSERLLWRIQSFLHGLLPRVRLQRALVWLLRETCRSNHSFTLWAGTNARRFVHFVTELISMRKARAIALPVSSRAPHVTPISNHNSGRGRTTTQQHKSCAHHLRNLTPKAITTQDGRTTLDFRDTINHGRGRTLLSFVKGK